MVVFRCIGGTKKNHLSLGIEKIREKFFLHSKATAALTDNGV